MANGILEFDLDDAHEKASMERCMKADDMSTLMFTLEFNTHCPEGSSNEFCKGFNYAMKAYRSERDRLNLWEVLE
jgi:hypothetical protein